MPLLHFQLHKADQTIQLNQSVPPQNIRLKAMHVAHHENFAGKGFYVDLSRLLNVSQEINAATIRGGTPHLYIPAVKGGESDFYQMDVGLACDALETDSQLIIKTYVLGANEDRFDLATYGNGVTEVREINLYFEYDHVTEH